MVKTFRTETFKDWYNCPIMYILPLLLDMEARNGEHQITPSNFMREMLLSTEQRYERLIQPVRKTSCISAKLKSFKINPDIIVFQNFARGNVYAVQLSLMNILETSNSLRVEMEPSPYFSFKQTSGSGGSKVAPGLKYTVEVSFSTDIIQDYKHKITFFTSAETFEVPIVAIGPRPILDLPDKITVPKTAVKVPTERTIVVKNIGVVWASFILETSEGFAVERSREVLKPNECCKMTIHFRPEQLGLMEGELKLTYETGEILYVKLAASAEEADLRLSAQKMSFPDCSLGMSIERVVTLSNDSDYVVDYRWISHDCKACNARVRSAIKERFEDMMEYELLKNNVLEYQDIVDSEMNKEIYQRILTEQKKECDLAKEPIFKDEHFVIEPSNGQLWPKTKVNFSVIYVPKTVDIHRNTAYLEVTGRFKAYHLNMFGSCEGPKVKMNLEELDAQNIYIGSVHRYEVVFSNPGAIPGTVRYKPVISKYGGVFRCNEQHFSIQPADIKSVYIEFTSLTRGKFVEVINFEVVESAEILSFIMKGNIVCPMLNFDITKLDFADLSVGETRRETFYLENNTQVAIDYQIEILAVTDNPLHVNSLIEDCAEFSCGELSGTVDPYTKVPCFVQVEPSAAIDKTAELAITMWESRQPSRTVAINYRAHVPLIECFTPNIAIKSMFIMQKYFRTLTLENKSDYSGNLTLKASDDLGYLEIALDRYHAFIEPWDTFEFRMEIKTNVIGDMNAKITGTFYGSAASFDICDIVVLSRGPCIDSDLMDCNIGRVKTLTTIEHVYHLSNASPIPATVHVNIGGPYITPIQSMISLEPEETKQSMLIIYGTNSGRFKTSVRLEIDGSDPDCVLFTGEFVGSSISTVPPLEPIYDLGSISTLTPFVQEVHFTNEGKVSNCITIKEYNTEVQHEMPTPVDNGRPYFILSTQQMIIGPGRAASLAFDCFARSPCKVKTRFVISAKRQTKRNQMTKKIFDFHAVATFEIPHVTMSKAYMEFRVDIGLSTKREVLEDFITFINQSNVPLSMDITIDEPFYFLAKTLYNREEVSLEPGEELTATVKFLPDLSEKKMQMKKGAIKVQYVSHPAMDKLPLIGIVNYPNAEFQPCVLDFGCIPIGHTGQKLVRLYNMSPLAVQYTLGINENDFIITPVTFQPRRVQFESKVSSYDSLIGYIQEEEAYLNQLARESFVGENYREVPEFQIECAGELAAEEEQDEEEESAPRTSDTQILSSDDCLEIAKQTFADSDFRNDLLPILYPLVDDDDSNVNILHANLVNHLKVQDPVGEAKRMLDIVPSSGVLAPFEYQTLSLAITLPPSTRISATIVCNVAGGASTNLEITAESGEILYHLKSHVIDFGIIAFNQMAEASFLIENLGYVKFQYCVRFKKVSLAFVPEPGWLQVEPAEGTVEEESTSEVIVQYFPGYPGYFETTATLEIAFFDPIQLTIRGCASLPQASFDFLRPLDEEQNYLSYSAIADITCPNHSRCKEEYTLQLVPDFDDWEFVRYKRHYPSARDIAMAVERKIIQNHLVKNARIVQYKYENPNAIIPDLVLPPYIIDFGYVILNKEKEIMIAPMKYTDAAMKLFWLRLPRKCSEYGFNMIFQKGQPGPFLVFKPSLRFFSELNVEIEGRVACVINATIKIDFEIKAIVTVPSLIFKHNSVDFGRVQCGFALRKTVFLENNGAVTCSYKMLIQSTSNRQANIFFTKARDGVVDAGQYAKLDIYFQPQSYTKYEWHLIVYLEANSTPLKIALRGHGFQPELEIIDDKIYFEPALPYSITNVKYCKIINRSQFPVEICFSDFDKETETEGEVIKTLLQYYNVKKLFIPPRQVGEPLPAILYEIYWYVMDHLKEILKCKIQNEYFSMLRKLGHDDRPADRPTSGSLPGSTSTSIETPIPNPLENKTREDIQRLISENVVLLRNKEYSAINLPRKGSIFELDCDMPVVEEENAIREGVLLMFHGSPLTDYVFAANKAAHTLKMHVTSVDQLIYESLARNEILAANKVNQMIEDNFNRIASDTDFHVPYYFDVFDVLNSRVALILSGKQQVRTVSAKNISEKKEKPTKGKGKGKGKKTASSNSDGKSPKTKSVKSDKSDKKQADKSENFLRLPIELYHEMMAESMSYYPKGLVIDSLNSVFVPKVKLVLLGLLNAMGNVRYVHYIYFNMSLDNFRAMKLDERRKSDGEIKLIALSIDDELERMLEMDEEQFEQLDPAAMELFKTLYLPTRKADTQARLADRKARITWSKSRASLLKHNFKSVVKYATSVKSKEEKPAKKTKRKSVGSKRRPSTQSQLVEKSLIAAEEEAVELRYILDNWNRLENKLEAKPATKSKAKLKAKTKAKAKDRSSKDTLTSKSSTSKNSSETSKIARNESGKKKRRPRASVPTSHDNETEVEPKLKTIKLMSPSDIQRRYDVGIPIWYMCNTHADSTTPQFELIANYLADNEEVLEALRLAHIAALGNHRESEQLYTVLTATKVHTSSMSSGQFVLYESTSTSNLVQPSNVLIAEELKTSKTSALKSQVKLGKLSTLHKSSTSTLSSKKARKQNRKYVPEKISKTLVPRRILQPNDDITLEVNFFPQWCGVFSHIYHVEIVTVPMPFRIYLEGKADIPRIYMEPHMMFSKVLSQQSGHDWGVAYFEREDVFHMGAVAVQPADSRTECLIVEDKLNMICGSFLPCNVSVDFLEPTANFTLEPTELQIAPNNSQFLKVQAHPVHQGNVNACLVLAITNNPRVNCINLSELGTHFKIDIKPRDVFFERVLLNRVVRIDVELKNTSLLGTKWEINFKNVKGKFGISIMSGYIKPLGINIVTFTYEATEYKFTPTQEIEIKFFDKNMRCPEPILTEIIQLSAEVVEVGLEFETDMPLGDMKIGQPLTFFYPLRNKSNFDLKANFLQVATSDGSGEMRVIRRSTFIDSMEAEIKANDVTKVPIRFKIDMPMEFRGVPVFNVIVSDPHIQREVLNFLLRVTGKVFSSTYKLCPTGDLVFSAQMVDTEVRKDIVLQNTGKYSFTFVVLNGNSEGKERPKNVAKKKGRRSTASSRKSRKSSAASKSTKSLLSKQSKKSKKTKTSKETKKTKKSKGSASTKKSSKKRKSSIGKKVKASVLKQGIFTIVPSSGVIQPHTEMCIQITCKTKKIGTYHENINFYISGVTGKYVNGHPFTLQGTACLPEIDFTNLEFIFKRHMIVQSQEDALCLEQLLSNCLFILYDKMFYFCTTCINTEVEAFLQIRNAGEIGAHVCAAIISNSPAFRVQPEKLKIEAYQTGYFSIFFKPDSLEKYGGSLHLTVEQTTQRFETGLYGEGCLPFVKITNLTATDSVNIFELDYKLVLVDTTVKKSVIFYNPGPLDANVTLGVVDDPLINVTLVAEDCRGVTRSDKNALLCMFENVTKFPINAGQTVEVEVLFKPKNEEILDAFINMFISNNPYDFVRIHLTGQGYKEDIIIENLPSFLTPENSISTLSLAEGASCPFTLLSYELDFGYEQMHKLIKKYFKLRNISPEFMYRFAFTAKDNLTFVPSAGHLKPLTSKDIIVTFYCEEPIHFENEVQLCMLSKIEYLEPQLEDIAWDERQRCTIWMPETTSISNIPAKEPKLNDRYMYSQVLLSPKVISCKEEPQYRELPGSGTSIKLMFNIVADYCTYNINRNHVEFPVTSIFESSVVDVIIENTSNVPVDIDWAMQIVNAPKKSLGQTRLISNAFLNTGHTRALRPQSCFIGKPSQPLTGNEQFFLSARSKSAQSKSSLFSTSFSSVKSAITSYNDTDPIPLTIEPWKCSILPGTTCTFAFKFSPVTPLDYKLLVTSDVQNLKPGWQPIEVEVVASCILPLYHFRLEPSDYLTARRGSGQHCEFEAEEGTKVLEFEAIGLHIPVRKSLSIINPTGEKFSYRWEKCVKERNIALFQCETPEGSVSKGRTADAVFTFIADKAGTFEMPYNFTIENYDLRVMFLLVGHARQPCVYFANNGTSLKPTVMGIHVHDTVVLKNAEDIHLTYRINSASLFDDGRLNKIAIEPSRGILQPKSDAIINMFFQPAKIGQFVFDVEFLVERMERPLVLTVSATCYVIEPTLKLVKEYTTTDLMIDTENYIQMPVLVQKNPEKCTFLIGNVGKVGIYYKWDFGDKFLDDYVIVDVEPREGYVKTDCEMQSVVNVKAVKFLSKKNIKLELKILYGPTISIILVCSTCKTRLKFSETLHDFGACLAQKHNTFSNEWALEMSNNDYITYIVQVENPNVSHISIRNKDFILYPKQTIKILFYFHPKEVAKYNTDINIIINDKKFSVTILGEGVSMEVELYDVTEKYLNFGAIPLGKYSRKRVHIINKTKCPVSIYFDLYNRLPICIQTTRSLEPHFEHTEMKPSDVVIKKKKTELKDAKGKKGSKKARSKSKSSKASKTSKESKKSKKSKESKTSKKSKASKKSKDSKKQKKDKDKGKGKGKDKGKKKEKEKKSKESMKVASETKLEPSETPEEKLRRVINSSIRIRPSKWIKLHPQHSIEFDVTFMPPERIALFHEQIHCQVQDTVIPLCAIKASCIAPEYSLHKTRIAFGTVILGSSNKVCTKLINSGDVGGRFKWSWKTARNEVFSISPMEGYSAPGTCTNFEVNFLPLSVQCNCASCAKVTIENYKYTFDLELTGTCINLPSPKDTLKFVGPVRESITKKFTLKNSTPEPWVITPISGGEFFHVDDLIVVEAKASSTVEVTYMPLAMTQGNKYHEGSIFLPLPEGQGMLYALLGEALRPKTSQAIEQTVPSKTYNVIILDVENWMAATQQFTVVNQIDQPDGAKKILYKLTGTAIIDVPPCATKPYKWIIYTLNEGKLNFTVKFRNETTKEYICYEIKLTVVKCQMLDNIVLSACARQVAEYKLRLENPLGVPTTYKMTSQCSDLHFVKEATVAALTEFEILIEYKPLYPTPEFTTVFEAVSPTLGTFPYQFTLTAKTAEPEVLITIKAHLGQYNMHNTYIYNPTQTNVEFTAKLDNLEFTVDKSAVIKPNERGAIEICFEPSDIGGVHSKLSLSSPTLGLYIFPLYGIGLPPKPQGPFTVKPNFQTFIPFKNPFATAMTFSYALTGSEFILQQQSEFIKPRSVARINVSCNRREITIEEPSSILTGKLSIRCSDESYSQIEWLFYLQSESK